MATYIRNKSTGFVSVADPYTSDDFVAKNFSALPNAPYKPNDDYLGFIQARRLLPTLLTSLRDVDGRPVPVVDCGVYMGTFSVAAGIAARAADIAVDISSYEANPELIESIKANVALYDVGATVRNQGVGGAEGEFPFVHSEGRMIGGTLFNIRNKKGEEGFREHIVPVVPLTSVVTEFETPGLIKLDIEGNEVPAFQSIQGQPLLLGNVFIVEFAPWQANMWFRKCQNYGEWLIENFDIINLVNWQYVPKFIRIETFEELLACLDVASKPFNADLLLFPKTVPEISERFLSVWKPTSS